MSEWGKFKLKEITSKIGSGATPTGGENSYKTSGITLIRSQNIEDFQFNSNGLAFIDNQQAKLLDNVTIEENDILINITGESVARCCLTPQKYLPARVNQHVSIIRPLANKADFRYIFYFLHFIKPELNSIAEIGCTRRALTKEMIENLSISLPPLPEQRAIAGVLSSLDDKIDLLQRQNKTLEEMAEALWRKMFIEEADSGWKKGKLGEEMDIIMGQSPPGNSYNEEKLGIIFFQGRAEFGFRFPETRLFCTDPKRLAQKRDTLVSVRAPVGDINMALEDCCIGRGLASVRHKKGFTSYTFYKIHSLKDDFETFEQQGTVFGSIGKDDFNNITTSLPSEEDIQEFDGIAKPIDDKIFTNSYQILTLSHLRDTILPKLMSGEVRVKL